MSQHETEQVVQLPLTQIRPNPYQPRQVFDETALTELATSIKTTGIFQPIIVRQPDPALARYEIIAGERRFRATQIAGLTTIPAIVRSIDDRQMMEVAVLENLQRENLSPIEEAQAYQTLMERLDLTQAQVAHLLGKSRPYIANYLRLLGLPEPVKQLVSKQELSMGQARTLLGLKKRTQITRVAKKAVKEGLTVRQLEQLVAKLNGERPAKTKTNAVEVQSPYAREVQNQLESHLGTKVNFSTNDQFDHGKIEIPYQSAAELERILTVLGITID